MSEHLCSLFLAFFIAKRNKENVKQVFARMNNSIAGFSTFSYIRNKRFFSSLNIEK